MRRIRSHFPVLVLLAVTAIWGWTFVVVRDAVHAYPVVPFLAIRFGIAALCLTPIIARSRGGTAAGAFPGIALASGYLMQTIGLQYTTASKAGLLTGLFVVLTPILALLVWRRAPRPATTVAVTAALAGTALLVGPGAFQRGSQEALGDTLEVFTAFAFSTHILLLSVLAPGKNAVRLAWMQMVVAASLFTASGLALHQFRPPTPTVWGALLITGVLASAVGSYAQTAVQQRISAARTAIVLAAEPAFAAFFGVVLAGDRFGPVQGLGAGLILAAIGFHEWTAAAATAPRSDASGPAPPGAESAVG